MDPLTIKNKHPSKTFSILKVRFDALQNVCILSRRIRNRSFRGFLSIINDSNIHRTWLHTANQKEFYNQVPPSSPLAIR